MIRFFIPVLFLLLASCHDSGGSVSTKETERSMERDSFVLFNSSGKNVLMGTDSNTAWSADRPQMTVILDYDFYLQKAEVTCKEFRRFMQGGAADDCIENLPVSGMTFYDAVLYANALSKSEGLDTAYTYVNASFDSKGHCVNLVGYRYLPEVDAYRLPTEAEWVFAASQFYEPEKAWNRYNSGFFVHEPCTADISESGVCDMAGNLKEWVNDWLGFFSDTTLVNYLGAPDGGALAMHVIKGGAFNMEPENSHPYTRGDVYTVSASSFEIYVGFRLAFGKISGGQWLGANGIPVSSNATVLVTSQDVLKKMGTANAKLVFRDNLSGNLQYVDFFDAKPRIVEINDTLDSYHPEISPDGKWVAFCTGMEGLESKSSVYIRRLDSQGTGLQRLEVDNASIPRFRITAEGDTVVVFVTSAKNNSEENDFKQQSTWQVPFSKGRFGTPEKLFDGSYHGGISRDNRLAVSGSRVLRARIADKGKSILDKSALDTVWYNGEQACNASLSKDASKRTLFLDFGGKTGKDFVGKNYKVHERILVVDSVGELIHSVSAPERFTFDHTEWVSEKSSIAVEKQDYAVASLTDNNGSHKKIALVNLSDGNVTNLIEGEDLGYPCLWVDKLVNENADEVLDSDSAGIYYSDKFQLTDALWRLKMELFWKYRDSIRVLVVGSSRPLQGFRSKFMDSSHFSVNVSQTPNSIFTSRDFLMNYAFNHLSQLRYVVVSLDIDFWNESDNEVFNFFKGEYKNYPGFVFDENHDFWKSGYPEGLYEKTYNSTSSRDYESLIAEKGSLTFGCKSAWDSIPPMDGDTTATDELQKLEVSLSALKDILSAAEKKDVTVIGVIFPQSPFYRDGGAYGRHGLRRSNAIVLLDWLKDLEKEYPNFVFMDENKMGDHDYDAFRFMDADHLCTPGAGMLTRRVESVILSLEKESELEL
ncbi:MAG: TIGR02171 family protein [Fibrobacter sp.]|nr:TIGR02171 family protein [Fibrobacter sp.]